MHLYLIFSHFSSSFIFIFDPPPIYKTSNVAALRHASWGVGGGFLYNNNIMQGFCGGQKCFFLFLPHAQSTFVADKTCNFCNDCHCGGGGGGHGCNFSSQPPCPQPLSQNAVYSYLPSAPRAPCLWSWPQIHSLPQPPLPLGWSAISSPPQVFWWPHLPPRFINHTGQRMGMGIHKTGTRGVRTGVGSGGLVWSLWGISQRST